LKVAVRSFSGVRSDVSDWKPVVDFAREAEALGVDSIWTSEAWGTDAISPLAYLAATTSKIRLGTGIIQVGTRTPGNLIMTALTMQSLSGGRFILGLGTSGPQVMEGWHGVRFSNPITRTREIIEIVKKGVAGEELSYKGKEYILPLPGGEGKEIRSSSPPFDVPIWVASLGPSNLEMTGAVADGWLGGSFIPESGNIFIDRIKAGAKKVGKDFTLMEMMIPLSLEFTDDVEEAGKRHARGYGFTFGAMGSMKSNFYKDAYARQGYRESVDRVQQLWKEGRREEAREEVPVELALKSNLIGTNNMVKDRIRLYKDLGITSLKVDLPGETMSDKLSALAELMELVKSVDSEMV
tara:strand:- start:908 stop:1963 length:1056 start_codon:yes stop_codon:yes gene_type:complete